MGNTSLESSSKISSQASTERSPLFSRPMVILKSDVVEVEVNFVKGENAAIECDYNCNFDLDRPITIATPKQINSRSSDQKEFLTTSSTSVDEAACGDNDKIVQRIANEVTDSLHFISPIQPNPPHEDGQVTTPVSSIPHSQPDLSGVPSCQPVPSPSTCPPSGPGKEMKPAQSYRQPAPSTTRPSLRPAPRMLRPARPGLHRKPAGPIVGGLYRQAGPRPRAPLPLPAGPRLPNVRSITPIKRRSLSTPQYSSQFLPPVVELDASPPRTDQASPHPQTSSVLSKLSSLGVSVAREKVSTAKHGWVLPPGISVTKTISSREEGPSLSLPNLAKALFQLGEGEGRKRLVQFNLTEEQIRALDALGVKEEGS